MIRRRVKCFKYVGNYVDTSQQEESMLFFCAQLASRISRTIECELMVDLFGCRSREHHGLSFVAQSGYIIAFNFYKSNRVSFAPSLHARGSNILFADAHAKYSPASKMLNADATNDPTINGDPYNRWTNKDGTIVITPGS